MLLRPTMVSLLFIFCCSVQSATAQDVKWGESLPVKSKTVFEDALLINQNHLILAYRSLNPWNKKWKLRLTDFDSKTLTAGKSGEISIEFEGHELEYKDILFLGDQIVMLSHYFNRIQQKHFLFATLIDPIQLQAERMIKLAEVATSNKDQVAMNLKVSQDTSFIAILAEDAGKNGAGKLKMTVLDRNFNYIHNTDLKIDADAMYSVADFEIDRKGDLYILRKYVAGKSVFNKSIIYDMDILRVNSLGILEDTIQLEVGTKILADLKWSDSDDEIVLGGLFSEENGNSTKGLCYARYSKNSKTLTAITEQYFNFEVLTSQLSNRGLSKATAAYDDMGVDGLPELYDVKIKELILRSDKGLIFLLEQSKDYISYENQNNFFYDPFFGYRYNPYMMGSNRTIYHHVRNDIYVANVDSTGSLFWSTHVPKLQHSINDRGYYLSFNTFNSRERLALLYNDNPANINIPVDGRLKDYSGNNGVPILRSIYLEGTTDEGLIRHTSKYGQVIPSACRQISNDKVLLVLRGVKSLKLGLLSI